MRDEGLKGHEKEGKIIPEMRGETSKGGKKKKKEIKKKRKKKKGTNKEKSNRMEVYRPYKAKRLTISNRGGNISEKTKSCCEANFTIESKSSGK